MLKAALIGATLPAAQTRRNGGNSRTAIWQSALPKAAQGRKHQFALPSNGRSLRPDMVGGGQTAWVPVLHRASMMAQWWLS